MEIQPVQPADLDSLLEIDGTINSTQYFHVERTGEGIESAWRLRERPLRERLTQSNPLDDEQRFWLKQIVTGADEGLALMAEHEGLPVGLVIASPDFAHGTMRIHGLRVDYDYRREGVGTAMLYQVINAAREAERRAVVAESSTNNFPAASLLAKCGFVVGGLDTQRHSNHDLVKETVTLFWYADV